MVQNELLRFPHKLEKSVNFRTLILSSSTHQKSVTLPPLTPPSLPTTAKVKSHLTALPDDLMVRPLLCRLRVIIPRWDFS